VRPLLPGPEDALRDAVVRLGVPVQELPRLARYGSVEALAVQGLTAAQTELLTRTVRAGGGDVLSNADGSRAVLLMPLLTAGSLAGALAPGGPDIAAAGEAIAAVLVARGAPPPPLFARGHRLEFGVRTLLMGIVNVTPDSFSGDGVGSDVGAAVAQARVLAEAGADVIDIGGESTRPSSTAVSAEEELARVLPVLRALADDDLVLSIDTRKASVARAALDAGACIVNDVWGLRGDPEMAAAVAATPDAGLVVMHNQRGVAYADLLGDVCGSLRESLAIAAAAGIAEERVIVDPGFGFAKTPAQNLELMRRLGELRGLGRAVMVGPSRKSTIGALTDGAAPGERLEGSVALAVLAVAAGAHVVRVHDVAATARALRTADAVVRGTPEHVRSLPMPGPTG
jgi:dihydropteroate synthase